MIGGGTLLKVKVKSLAEEARIIHKEEERAPRWLKGVLFAHRKHVVAKEERDSLIAYACLRFHPYSSVEGYCREEPDWDNVKRIVKKFGDYSKSEGYAQWFEDAQNWYEKNQEVMALFLSDPETYARYFEAKAASKKFDARKVFEVWMKEAPLFPPKS